MACFLYLGHKAASVSITNYELMLFNGKRNELEIRSHLE